MEFAQRSHTLPHHHYHPRYSPQSYARHMTPAEHHGQISPQPSPYPYPTGESRNSVRPDHYQRPQQPPTPPMDRAERTSLPPISTLLNYSHEGTQQAQHRPASPTQHSHTYHPHQKSRAPPTPPMQHRPAKLEHRPELVDYRPGPPAPSVRYTPPTHNPHHFEPRESPASGSLHRPNMSASSWSSASTSPNTAHSAVSESTSGSRLYPPPLTQSRSASATYSNASSYSPMSASSTVSAISADHPWAPPHFSPSQRQANQYHSRHSPSAPGACSHRSSNSSTHSAPSSSAPVTPLNGPVNTSAQIADRYICPSCAKAFSRPSSLRIHVHSHTGEKPFQCPHPGCGKRFSVRSNMKRHQRCHAEAGNSLARDDVMEVDEDARSHGM